MKCCSLLSSRDTEFLDKASGHVHKVLFIILMSGSLPLAVHVEQCSDIDFTCY